MIALLLATAVTWSATLPDSGTITLDLLARTESARRLDWIDTQRAARATCATCSRSSDWPGEADRGWSARASGDKFRFEPLAGFTFVGVEIIERGSWTPLARITLRDGATLISRSLDIHPRFNAPRFCDLLLPQLGRQSLSPARPKAFVLCFDTRRRGFTPAQVQAIAIHINGAWMDLTPERK